MANAGYLALLEQGVEAWNKWRIEHLIDWADLYGVDFSFADLAGADLAGADFSGTDFTYADFTQANLIGADFSRANLSEAHLSGADLSLANLAEADFTGADLSKANLTEADFRRANLTEADLNGTNFNKTNVAWTLFAGNDLSEAKGLETVHHIGPSTIGIDTIYKSAGRIPQVFLRGAGVPDNFIPYIASLTGKGMEFYSCFISYSTKDQEFVDRLHADLQNNNVRCWFAPHDIAAGKKIHEQIDEAIRMHDKLLLILSPASMESEWVKTEIAKARKREIREGNRVLFPVGLVKYDLHIRDWECFDADTGKDSAREIREYFIPDFSDWKNHDSYQIAFKRLLHDLKAKESKPQGHQ